MYKHILLPIDGSELSQSAVRSGLLLAKSIGARVTGIHIMPRPRQDQLDEWAHHDVHYSERLLIIYRKFAARYLAFIAENAQQLAVPSACISVESDEPWAAILKVAEEEQCDLIFMASHGWSGTASQLLGSETLKVLSHAKLPVLVHHSATRA